MNETGVALVLLITLCGCVEYPEDTEYSDDTGYLLLEEEDYEVTPTTTQKTPDPAEKTPAEKTVKQPEPPCSTLKGEERDTCLYGLVIKNNDVSLCDKI